MMMMMMMIYDLPSNHNEDIGHFKITDAAISQFSPEMNDHLVREATEKRNRPRKS